MTTITKEQFDLLTERQAQTAIKKAELKKEIELLSARLAELETSFTATQELLETVEVEAYADQVIDQFLADWKQKATSYYTNLRQELVEKREAVYEVNFYNLSQVIKRSYDFNRLYSDERINEILEQYPTMTSYDQEKIQKNIRNSYLERFKKELNKTELSIIESMYSVNYLDQILTKEVARKKKAFIARIEKITGEIKDFKGLQIGQDGEINGYVVGSEANATVKTISAGGYNVQCFHYRILVKKIK